MDDSAIILVPQGRDAALLEAMLDEAGLLAKSVTNVPLLVNSLQAAAGFVIVSEEALCTADLTPLVLWRKAQPAWSDLPFILLTRGGGQERNPLTQRLADSLGNVTLMERPFHSATLVSLARSSVRARRKQYEARDRLDELHRSEERFRAAISAVQGVLWTSTADGQMDDNQLAWEDLTGQAPDDYRGFGWSNAVHPDDKKPTVDAWNDAVRARAVLAFEHRVRRCDGEWRNFSIRAVPIFDTDGNLREWVGVHTDITSRRRAENALRKLNDELEAQIQQRTAERDRVWVNSRDMLVIFESDGRFRAVNPAWESVLGYRPDELLGREYLEFIVADDHQPSVGALLEKAKKGTLPIFENRYYHKDGTERTISWLAAPEGELIFAYGRDVTAEKCRQAELAAAHEQLRESQKMEALGQLTGGVAHNFNNLLTPILGSLDMLQRNQVGTEREQRLIEGALQSTERAKTLVQRLLAFARRQPLQSSAVDIERLVEGMADLLASTTGPEVRIAVEMDDELPPAHADANQLEMALLNLGVNARDAMPDGGTLRISANLHRLSEPRGNLISGDYIRLSVADTGVGMDRATLARAAEPFFSTKGVGKGTGLGLSMVHGLAAQLGGALTMESRQGVGTNIEIWLPVSKAAIQPAQSFEVSAQLEGQAGIALLVDDEDIVRASTADMLTDFGYSVTEASSAESALDQIKNGFRPDLVVTDHLMPGMSGVDLVRAIHELLPSLPALIISGYAQTDGIAADLPRLTKPFRQSDFAASIASL